MNLTHKLTVSKFMISPHTFIFIIKETASNNVASIAVTSYSVTLCCNKNKTQLDFVTQCFIYKFGFWIHSKWQERSTCFRCCELRSRFGVSAVLASTINGSFSQSYLSMKHYEALGHIAKLVKNLNVNPTQSLNHKLPEKLRRFTIIDIYIPMDAIKGILKITI